MNIKLISRYIGVALLFNAAFMALSMVVSMLYDFDESLSPLLLSTIITSLVGVFPLIFVKKEGVLNLKEGFAITVFTWVLSFIFGMLPYLLFGGPFSLSNAWFESVSGYTTTGSTILTDIESLPKGLLFWRYSTHYIGGIGVMIFMLMVLPTMSAFQLRKIEISSLSKDNYRYRTREMLRVITYTYIGITLLTFISLLLAGMPAFDAIGHSMTIVSTGGFSNRNLSIASYNSPAIERVCILFMYLSSLHFGLMYATVVNKSKMLIRSGVFRYYTSFLILFSLAVAIDLMFNGGYTSWELALRRAMFQVVSMATTTGLATADTNTWPLFSILALGIAMLHGGCSGSTSGGVKADRIWIFFKSLRSELTRMLHPTAYVQVKVGKNSIDHGTVSNALLFIVTFFFTSFVVTLVLLFGGLDFTEALSASVSSLSNSGPGYGECGSLGSFAAFSSFEKLLLTIEMFLGRVEIFALLVFFKIFQK